MSTERPLVSVVMPCYNAAPFVAEAMESVLAQSYAPVELVVVDDASTDGSGQVVRALAECHPDRVRAVRLDRNRGGCHARNRGVEVARGELLMFLDADDRIAPDTIAALVEALRGHLDGIAACDWRHLQRVDGEWRETPSSLPLPEPGADLFRVWLDGSAWAPTCSVLWRREVYERTGGWDEELTREQDDDLMLRAYARGARLVIARGGLGLYRLHEELALSVTRGVAEDKLRSSVRLLEKLAAELERRGRMGELGARVGNVYHQLALRGFQQGHRELARECLRRGEALAGRRVLSPKPVGRALERLLGLERKERLVQVLARYGVATRDRRHTHRVRRVLTGLEPVAPGSTAEAAPPT
ncbi:MAG TPA: glycosyltransferase family A protein [Longimicrobiaceae bacterium]|nr:glycosyltransferase family A protein [Longimicrobiaceae bacterium]